MADDNGVTKEQHIRQAVKQTSDPEKAYLQASGLSEFEFPRELEFVWSVFLELNPSRSVGFAANPLSYVDILAWSTLKQIVLKPWEVDVIRQLDQTLLKVYSDHARSSRTKHRSEDPRR